jgi:Flp pilus assembly protein TadG
LTVILPIMMFIMLGILDVGRLFFSYIQITSAVREGAGYGAHLPDETTKIVDKVVASASGLGVTASNVTVTCAPVECTAVTNANKDGVTISVSATWTFAPIYGGFLNTIAPGQGLDTMNLTTQNTMRIL